ncbi:MAG: RNA methyltransferase [Bacteroidetes bacterium]|jgi:TrmH family RNA methyltransferase|nr:RNA methyltransferase [Bacteroidota bacterium]
MPLSRRRKHAISQLTRKRTRDEAGEMLVEGIRGVESAVAAEAPLVELVVTPEAAAAPRVAALLEAANAPVHTIAAEEMRTLSATETSQGVLAVVETHRTPPEALMDVASVLLLDGVQDPGNVGTMIRTAAWFGVDAVASAPGTAGFFGPKVVRAAAGSLWDVRLSHTTDAAALLEQLRRHDFRCYGADLHGTPAAHWTPARPAVLVMGSEAHGLSPAVRDVLDEPVAIPGSASRDGAESLNVAVAAGILIHAWLGEG